MCLGVINNTGFEITKEFTCAPKFFSEQLNVLSSWMEIQLSTFTQGTQLASPYWLNILPGRNLYLVFWEGLLRQASPFASKRSQ